jgi:alpha-L-fucosidase
MSIFTQHGKKEPVSGTGRTAARPGIPPGRVPSASSRRQFIGKSAWLAAAAWTAPLWQSCSTPPGTRASRLFQPDWDSLAANYQCPDWFRDAKFGIWAHWTPQCVPEQGDWYARQMYIQNHPHYNYHVKTYGHPSRFGFMEITHLWKAEHWEPEKLMDLYTGAGARYFVCSANHHDNFDNYDSKYHAWNSVNVGPKKDIVGVWEKIARRRGLRFGVTNHASHAWHWFQTAYGYDAQGPYAGVRYDAYTLTRAAGKGKWWEGLDPQELYTGRNLVIPDGIVTVRAMNDWHGNNDSKWNEEPPPMNPEFAKKWLLRCRDLVDKYRPDLLYFDDTGLPLGQAGLDMAAHFYNASMKWHGGRLEAVVNCKLLPPARRSAVVEDIERGLSEEIRPAPWQTDTCIGDWAYDRNLFARHGYKSVTQVVVMLADIVSKNGNLLLNIPTRGDGTIDEDERAFLQDMARWMKINGEAIFASRPWKVSGEGPARGVGGMFNESRAAYGARDIRFTAKGGALYAFALGWPTEPLEIKSLGTAAGLVDRPIAQITLLGSDEPVQWTRTQAALVIQPPRHKPCDHAIVFKVHFGLA